MITGKTIGYAILIILALVVIVYTAAGGMPHPFGSMQALSVWIASLLTFFIYSFLYKDNPFYKFAEYLAVGVSAGYYTVIFWHNYIKPNLWDHLINPRYPHRWILVIPTILGFMLLTRVSKKYGWISRYSLAIYLGASAGILIPREMEAKILRQIHATMLPLWPRAADGSLDIWALFANLVMIVGVFSTLAYFFFSKEHKGVLGGTARVGITFIMVGFGATFGYTVMARVSLLIGRVRFLITDWLQLID
ncbi:hypothetical protein ACFLU6_08275 [Acidobacteriota bacterium]